MTDLLHARPDEAPPASPRVPMEPEIRHLPMRETAVVTVEVETEALPDAIGGAIGEVEAAMREAGVGLAGPPFARYLAFGPRIRAEIGFPVQRPAPQVGRVVPGRLPGGRIATIVHLGSYDGLHETYAHLTRWLGELGLQPAGPLWEVYWSNPEEQPDPTSWRTEIFAPVE